MVSNKTIDSIIRKLKGWYRATEWWRNVGYTPFEIMVAIAVSQRTHYKQVARFIDSFRSKYRGIEDVVKVRLEKLEVDCKEIGMAKKRSLLIQQLARRIMDNGGMDSFLRLTPEKATEILLSVKGIGEKTADMILVALFGEKYFVVDSNILRVLKRLGIVPINSDIYSARKLTEHLIQLKHRVFLHTALVSLGQRICKPSNPLCHSCPLHTLCNTYGRGD